MLNFAGRNQPVVFLAAVALLLAALPSALHGQSAVSVRPAMIHLAEGDVILRGFAEHMQGSGRYRHLAEGQRMILRDGRAEIFLNLGTTMRIGAHSEVEMVRADLDDIQVRLVEGAAVFEVRDKQGVDAITILAGDATVRFDDKGLYRIDRPSGGPPLLKVFEGSTTAVTSDHPQQIGAKQSLVLAAAPDGGKIKRFKRSKPDALDDWHQERASMLSQDRPPGGGDAQSEAEKDLLQNVYRAERDAARGSPGRRSPIGGAGNSSRGGASSQGRGGRR